MTGSVCAPRHRLAAVDGVAAATGVVVGYATVVGRDGQATLLPGFDVVMTGTNWTGTGRLRLDQGRPPTNAAEIAISAPVARESGLAIGESTRVLYGSGSTEVTVTGIYTYRPHGRETAAPPGVAFDPDTAGRLLAQPGHYTAVELSATAGTSPAQLADRVGAVLPEPLAAYDRDRLAADLADRVQTTTASVRATAFTFAAIALLVGSTLIVNTFSMLVVRRARELALLRAVGATRRQVRWSVLAEAAVTGLAAAALGLLAGIAVAAPVTAYAARFDPTLPGTVHISPIAPVIALSVGLGVTVLAAWLPARRAARIPPAAALRTAPSEARRSSRWRRWTGIAVAAPAAAALGAGGTGNTDGDGLLGMLGALLLLLAALLLVPTLSTPLVRLLGRPLRRYGTVNLAVESTLRGIRRASATAATLLVGVAITTGIATFAATVTNASLADMTGVLGDDLVIANIAGGQVDPQLADTVAGLPGVAATTALRPATVEADGRPVRAAVLDPAALDTTVHLDLGGVSPEALGNGVFVIRKLADERGWSPGDQLTLRTAGGDGTTVRIAAVLPEAPLLGELIVNAELVDRHAPPASGNPLLVAPTPGANSDQLIRDLRSAIADRPDLRVFDAEDYIRSVITEIDAFLGLSGGMLGLSILISFLGIANTLTLSTTERTHELGLLRAVGMTRRQVRITIRTEALLMAAVGGLLGLATGLTLGAMMQHFVLGQPVPALTPPWATIGLVAAGLTIGGLIAAAWPARRAASTPLLHAIARE